MEVRNWRAAVLALFACAGPARGAEFHVEVDAGYRQGQLDWSISDVDDSPNVLSELTWSDLQIFQLRSEGALALAPRVAISASLALGSILDGDNQDSDYGGDHRTLEFSRSNNTSEDAYVLDGSLALEMRLFGSADGARLLGKVGYHLAKQNLRMTEGFQTLSEPANVPPGFDAPTAVGPFSGLDSTYDARWEGPWIGLEYDGRISQRSRLRLEAELHYADYHGTADWNLRDDFAHPKSFEHLTDGTGAVVALTWARSFQQKLPFYVRLDASRWTTAAGIDRVFLSDGTEAVTQLNEVNWSALTLSLGRIFR